MILTIAELCNLRTACLTSAMRENPEWKQYLDQLADRLYSERSKHDCQLVDNRLGNLERAARELANLKNEKFASENEAREFLARLAAFCELSIKSYHQSTEYLWHHCGIQS